RLDCLPLAVVVIVVGLAVILARIISLVGVVRRAGGFAGWRGSVGLGRRAYRHGSAIVIGNLETETGREQSRIWPDTGEIEIGEPQQTYRVGNERGRRPVGAL